MTIHTRPPRQWQPVDQPTPAGARTHHCPACDTVSLLPACIHCGGPAVPAPQPVIKDAYRHAPQETP